jgi:hypothetical protein
MTEHRHEFAVIERVDHAEIDEHDPMAHTSFMLLGCACGVVTAFPVENARLCTPRFLQELAEEIEQTVGWRFTLEIT